MDEQNPPAVHEPVAESLERRKKRLEKNRDAARIHRNKNKAYVQDLEARVASLTQQLSESKAAQLNLSTEVRVLNEQLVEIRSMFRTAANGMELISAQPHDADSIKSAFVAISKGMALAVDAANHAVESGTAAQKAVDAMQAHALTAERKTKSALKESTKRSKRAANDEEDV